MRTARQRAALRKAQLASARKRRKGGSRKRKYARRAAKIYGASTIPAMAGIYLLGRNIGASPKSSAYSAVKVGSMYPYYTAKGFYSQRKRR